MKQVALRLDDELAAAIDKGLGTGAKRETWIKETLDDVAGEIDLGPDFPLDPEAKAQRQEIREWLINALHGVRHDPMGGNVVHCIQRALDATGAERFPTIPVSSVPEIGSCRFARSEARQATRKPTEPRPH